MKYLDLTLPSAAGNLACDEALLDICEDGTEGEVLRFWQPSGTFVVVGYANEAAREVDLEACKLENIEVFRRCTGGGTVVQMQGCLNYSVILEISKTGALSSITGTNRHVLDRTREVIDEHLKSPVAIRGHTDLTVGDLKFSGNAQRRKRKFLIFHGTFLLNANLDVIEKLLRMPSKQPDYRHRRSHTQFLTNIELEPELLKESLRKAWQAEEPLLNPPLERISSLANEKYSTHAWNHKF